MAPTGLDRVSFRISDRQESWDRTSLDTGLTRASGGVTWLSQPHGNVCVTVRQAGEHRGAQADASVTRVPGIQLAIRTADCVPVLFVGESTCSESDSESEPEAILGLAHAGWQGLRAGIVESTIAAMRALGAVDISAWIGPSIGPECYEFGTERIAIAAQFGDAVLAETSWGTPALDMAAGVQSAVSTNGAHWKGKLPDWSCTSCDTTRFSHRARGDVGRMALVASLRQRGSPMPATTVVR